MSVGVSILVTGPTAAGKSVLARVLALVIPGALVVDDPASFQMGDIRKQLEAGGVVILTIQTSLAGTVRQIVKFDIVIEVEGTLGGLIMAGPAARAVLAGVGERRRQQAREGYDAAHDAQHLNGELATAAACYATNAGLLALYGELPQCFIPKTWPWERRWWRAGKVAPQAKRDVEKAIGLLLAEWERLDCLEKAATGRAGA